VPPRTATPSPAPAPGGTWRIQFGAFGVIANADKAWNQVRSRPELAGHPRINLTAGGMTKVQAGGYSETAARAACVRLASANLPCIAVRN
jgi:hypothetical protein